MRELKYFCLPRSVLAFVVIVLTLAFAVSAGAASSIVRPYIGYTKIKLSDEFVDMLIKAKVDPAGIRPGFLNLKRKMAIFPIVSGLVDPVNLDVEINHAGGISFTGHDGNKVPIYNLMISNLLFQEPFFPMFEFEPFPGIPTTITGLVVFDGDMIEARDAFSSLFIVDIQKENITVKRSTLIIRKVTVTMGDLLAVILNGSADAELPEAELPSFEPGQPVGVAKIYARFHRDRKHYPR